MKFDTFLKEEKNTHMVHLEDLLLDGGVKGARDAINALQSLRDMLAGTSRSRTNVTVKWDGAPAVFAGTDPTDGKFFVAKKGIFNKTPKVYKSHAEIDADTTGDLSKKLKVAFDELKKCKINGVIQGDIMFTKDDLKSEKIDGVDYWVFHPNTIAYAVEKNSQEGKRVRAARVGIVFHTSYSGNSFESMTASYGFNVDTLKAPTSLWAVSANLRDLSGTANMTVSETNLVTALLSSAGNLFRKVPGSFFDELKNNDKLNLMVNAFNNTFYRSRTAQPNPNKKVNDFIAYVESKYRTDADKLVSPLAKARKEEEMKSVVAKIDKINLAYVFEMQQLLSDAKLIIINKLNTLNMTKTFVKTSHGYKVTSAEGFVAIGSVGNAVKLVDRLEFSTNNFDPNVIKGWQSVNRR